MKIFCLFDRKSGTYGTVFTSDNYLTAQRYFQYLCSMPANEMIRDDVELYALADYDNKTGVISDVCKDFVCNFTYDDSITNMIREQTRSEVLKSLGKELNDIYEK